nr:MULTISPECIES: substrate-binding domain-containing protein [unclassified Oceanispirochaeta]
MTIGILIPNLRSHFDTTIIAMVEEELTNAGYSVIICAYHKDIQLERDKLKFLLQRRVDGLIIIPSGDHHPELDEFLDQNHPIVLIDRPVEGVDVDTIIVDNEQSSRFVTEYLLRKGHRDIGIICGNETTYTSKMRLSGYLEAHKRAGVSVDMNLICYGDWSRESGYQFAKSLVTDHNHMTALISCSDDVSIGVLRALAEMSVKIPSELSIISYDLLEYAEIFMPAITTIEQPIKDIGRKAAQLLLQRLAEKPSDSGNQAPQVITMKTQFIERLSVSDHSVE